MKLAGVIMQLELRNVFPLDTMALTLDNQCLTHKTVSLATTAIILEVHRTKTA